MTVRVPLSRLALGVLAFGLLAGLPVAAQSAATDQAEPAAAITSVALRHRAQRSWSVELPRERFRSLGNHIPLPHAGGEGFKVKLEGTALRVDSDGDGAFDVKVEGTEGFVTLRGKREDGTPLRYAVRLKNAGKGWTFGPGGLVQGKLNGVKLRIIDQNLNGRYDDYGKDAMIVGAGRNASFLSKAVNVDGKLLEVSVAADGRALSARPYQGDAGVLDLRGGFDSKARLLSAIVVSADEQFSFDLASAAEGLSVPAGSYRIHRGALGFGEGRLAFRTGRSRSVKVTDDEKTTVAWGDGPVSAEFGFVREADKVGFDPNQIWYFGAAGEEYLGWAPIGKSPKFTITDQESGREVAVAHFPGSC